MARTALIIGITGNFGGAVAAALAGHGWRVRALHRRPETAPTGPAVERVRGDALEREAVVRAAEGAQLIVHAANPPGYRNWRGLALPMLANTLAAARAAGARVLFPGNVYNYGPDAWEAIGEHAPQHPLTRKGRLRVEMEAMIRAADVPSLILRAGDFFGGHRGGSWFEMLVKPGRPPRRIVYPGRLAVGHAWAYLPDLAETAARLLEEAGRLQRQEVFHFGGHYLSGHELVAAIAAAAGRELPVRRLPWPALHLAAPFHETAREVLEMRYLWRESVRLTDERLRRFLGRVPHTPLREAVAAALAAAGCTRAAGETAPERSAGAIVGRGNNGGERGEREDGPTQGRA